MTIKYVIGLAVPGIAAILLSSCGSVPQKEIDAAQAALDSAKTIGAEIYASEDFVELQDSLTAILAQIQEEKSGLFANYDSITLQLGYISAQAGEVANQTEAKKVELTSQIQSTIAEVKTLINTNKQIILEAPKVNGSDLQSIQQELSSIESTVAETDSLLTSGQLIPGLDKAIIAKQKATSINAELQTVVDKSKTKTRKS